MNHLEGSKTLAKVSVAVATNATHSHEIDTYGADYASIDVVFSAFSATTSAYASVLKVQESNSSGSGQTDISGYSITAVLVRRLAILALSLDSTSTCVVGSDT